MEDSGHERLRDGSAGPVIRLPTTTISKTFLGGADPTREEVDAFLAALTRLSHEHGIYLAADGGCGCCGAADMHVEAIRHGDGGRVYRQDEKISSSYVRRIHFSDPAT